jgi:lipopolysaccharide export LptBFGC system permease protein LptF
MFRIKKIHLLLASEIVSLSAVVAAALTTVMFLFRVMQYSEYVFMSSEGLFSIFMFIVFLFPTIFKLTVPLALFVGTTLAVARMAQDREVEAWMSSGVSVLRMSVAPAMIGATALLLTLAISLFVEPFSRQELLKYKWMFARRNVEAMIESKLYPRTFVSEPFESGETDICLYVDWLSESRRDFKGVFLAMQTKRDRHAAILVAESGSLQRDVQNGSFDYIFSLKNGRMYEPVESEKTMADVLKDAPQSIVLSKDIPKSEMMPRLGALSAANWRVMSFSDLDLSLVSFFSNKFSISAPDANDMRTKFPKAYVQALQEVRKRPNWKKDRGSVRDHTFFYEQIAIPFGCFFLPLLGVALGVHDPRRKIGHTYIGIGVCVFLFYAAVMAGQQLPLAQMAPSEIMLVLPPLVMILMTTFMMRLRLRFPPSVGVWEYVKILRNEARRAWLKLVGREGDA